VITRALRAHARLALPLVVLALSAGCGRVARSAGQTDVVYGTADGHDLKLDIYPCSTPGLHPACLLIHGGGWGAGTKSDERGVGMALSQNGIVCFAVDYRLAPKFTHPAQVLDCARAVRWVRAHAARYGVDPERLGAWGASAGGHLALMLGVIEPGDYQSDDDPNRALSARAKCVVDFFGPTDLRGPSSSVAASFYVTRFIGSPPGAAADEYADASPVTHVTGTTSPVLFIHGDQDKLVPLSQSQAMKAALDAAGVENELIVVKGASHNLNGVPAQDVAMTFRHAEDWLSAHLKP
jgi:acetyl esterase/lipase